MSLGEQSNEKEEDDKRKLITTQLIKPITDWICSTTHTTKVSKLLIALISPAPSFYFYRS